MLTLRENIRYLVERCNVEYRATIIHFVKWIALILAISLAFEIFVFNFNSFASASYDTINLSRKIDLKQDKNDMYLLTAVDHDLEFSNLNVEMHNIAILFDTTQPAQNLDVKIQFTDEAHMTFFDSTEYTVGIPDVTVSTASRNSQYINIQATGEVYSLRMQITSEDAEYPIKLEGISINAHRPFNFNWIRFLALFGCLLVVFCFRPSSVIYRIRITENPIRAKAGIITALIIECSLITTFLFFGSNLVGIATQSYNQGQWDGQSIVNVFEVGGENAQQYAELAKSMAQGKLYLEEDPPEWLKEMSTPYDRGARDELQKQTGENYLFDTAYYDGHYYVYFGVVPVILFYLPFYLLTGANFPTALGVLLALLAFIVGVTALLHRFASHHFKRVSLGLYLLMQIALLFGCGILYLAKFPTFYSLPISCGLAFSVWGLYFWLCGRSTSSIHALKRRIFYLAGSLCMALVLGCRPQLLVLSLIAFPLFWNKYITKKEILSKRGIYDFVCLIAPYLFVGILIMLYNHARFQSFFDFGANYNLTVNDMTQRGWVFGRFAPAFFAYFLQLPNTVGQFPFLQPCDFATTYMGQTIKETTFGGIFACFPLLWILFFLAPIIRIRNSQRDTKTISGVIGVLLISGVVVAMLDAQMAGILQRYYADFSLMFFASVVLLVFIVNENLVAGDGYSIKPVGYGNTLKISEESPETIARNLLTKLLIALVTLCVLYSTLICFVPEVGWYSDIYPWAYRDVLETVQFWT